MRPTRLIKRYLNRKLYDTVDSTYVKLDEIAKFLRSGEDVIVVDNASKRDITKSTLIQLIFEAERKVEDAAPLSLLKEVARASNGTFTRFIQSLGHRTQEDDTILASPPNLETPNERPRANVLNQ